MALERLWMQHVKKSIRFKMAITDKDLQRALWHMTDALPSHKDGNVSHSSDVPTVDLHLDSDKNSTYALDEQIEKARFELDDLKQGTYEEKVIITGKGQSILKNAIEKLIKSEYPTLRIIAQTDSSLTVKRKK